MASFLASFLGSSPLELGLPVGDGLGSDSGQGLDDLLDLGVVVQGRLELVRGVDADGGELLDVLVVQTVQVLEILHGHSFTL